MLTLLYHAHQGNGVSPFDEAVLRVARSGAVRVVSPYIGISYLERIISVSPEWRLVSDVEEWLASLSTQARPRAWAFIREHLPLIHHCPALHAKAVISDSLAMMGSANLTNHGILGRTEMGILLDDPRLVAEMGTWFEDLWQSTVPPLVDEASAYVQWLDTEAKQVPSRRQRVVLSSGSRKIRARLAKLEAPPVSALEQEGPLDLSVVARAIIVRDQQRYDSLDSALEAALDRLTAVGDFCFGDVVAAVRQGFAGASVREIYFLLVQHCANHVRSVFAETTQNRLILKAGRFSQSSREALEIALVPFDAFLTYLVNRLSATEPRELPPEAQVEQDTGVSGPDSVVLVSELLDCGLLVLDDVPGALPRYGLDPEFEWEGRYRLFPRARAAWGERLRGDHSFGHDEELPDDADAAESSGLRGRRHVHVDILLDDFEDSDASYDEARVARDLREADRASRQQQLTDIEAARRKAERERQQVDSLLARLLRLALDGQVFTAPSRRGVAQAITKATGVTTTIATRALNAPVFQAVSVGTDAGFRLEINTNLTVEMLADYPKTRAACESLLGEAQS
jgi:hypothetical protein